MKLIHFLPIALVLAILEASIVSQCLADAEKQDQTPAPIEGGEPNAVSEQQISSSATKSSGSKKGPKIKRTIRVKESQPASEQNSPAAPSPSIHNEGAQNNVDMNPNINLQMQPASGSNEPAPATSAAPEVSRAPVEEAALAKPTANSAGSLTGNEILEAGDISSNRITKIGNISTNEVTEIGNHNGTCPYAHLHVPHAAHEPCKHRPAAEEPRVEAKGRDFELPGANQVKFQGSGNAPLFQITINGQENQIDKFKASPKDEPRDSAPLVEKQAQPQVLLVQQQPTVSELYLNGGRPSSEERELFRPYLGPNSNGKTLASAKMMVSSQRLSSPAEVAAQPMSIVQVPVQQASAPQQIALQLPHLYGMNQLQFPLAAPMPIQMQMPPPMPFAMQQPMQLPMPYPMQFPMPMPMIPAWPMWPQGYNYPAPWIPRRPKKAKRTDEGERKREPERPVTEAAPTTTTPAPTTTTTSKPWRPNMEPYKSTTTTTTTTPKPVEEIEWEMVRVPKIKKKVNKN